MEPFHYLRENKMITGAGADRVQDGMRLAFGKVISIAARTNPGQPLISIRCNPPHIKSARTALKRAAPKLPTPCSIVFDEIDPDIARSIGYGQEF
jgi:large subunit ribosomal protein L10e